MNHREGTNPSHICPFFQLSNIRGIRNAPLRYYDCVSIFTSAPENLTGGYFYSAVWLVIYLKRAVIGNHFHVFRQFLSSSKWQVILPVEEIEPIFYWEERQFFNNARSLIMLREVNGLCVWGPLQKMTKASKMAHYRGPWGVWLPEISTKPLSHAFTHSFVWQYYLSGIKL